MQDHHDEQALKDYYARRARQYERIYAKPERQIYELSLHDLQVQPQDSVFIGDGGSGELEGAQAVGLTTVMMTGIIKDLWPDRIEPRKPYADFVIESLTELIQDRP